MDWITIPEGCIYFRSMRIMFTYSTKGRVVVGKNIATITATTTTTTTTVESKSVIQKLGAIVFVFARIGYKTEQWCYPFVIVYFFFEIVVFFYKAFSYG